MLIFSYELKLTAQSAKKHLTCVLVKLLAETNNSCICIIKFTFSALVPYIDHVRAIIR